MHHASIRAADEFFTKGDFVNRSCFLMCISANPVATINVNFVPINVCTFLKSNSMAQEDASLPPGCQNANKIIVTMTTGGYVIPVV